MKRPRPQYVAAGLIGVVGLLVAAIIAALGFFASGYVPTAPSSYSVKPIGVAEFAPHASGSLNPPFDLVGTAAKTGVRTFTLVFITSGGGCTPK